MFEKYSFQIFPMTMKNEKKISWWFLSLISSYRLILKCIKRIPVAEYKHGVFSGDKTSTKTRYWPQCLSQTLKKQQRINSSLDLSKTAIVLTTREYNWSARVMCLVKHTSRANCLKLTISWQTVLTMPSFLWPYTMCYIIILLLCHLTDLVQSFQTMKMVVTECCTPLANPRLTRYSGMQRP